MQPTMAKNIWLKKLGQNEEKNPELYYKPTFSNFTLWEGHKLYIQHT